MKQTSLLTMLLLNIQIINGSSKSEQLLQETTIDVAQVKLSNSRIDKILEDIDQLQKKSNKVTKILTKRQFEEEKYVYIKSCHEVNALLIEMLEKVY